ncbi:hypothetical protein AAFC00_006284 [Neodothiora populina]|uniref:Zn(2)-C6 fungal-type domain-containing protein n=1 Tax=Neodothiora populina TaxID=2781224 RepID=A0ABR3P4U1_9PEZI
MDVGNLLAGAAAHLEGEADDRARSRQYPTRPPHLSQGIHLPARQYEGSILSPTRPSAAMVNEPRPSPGARQQKQVTFELVFPEGQNRARLPMRVMISPHDTTLSIITTVKNFYGLYEGPGLIFQDEEQNILIASYDNFHHGMTVWVTVTPPDPTVAAASVRSPSTTLSPRKPKHAAALDLRPHTHSSRPASRTASRPASRNARPRSLSPQSIRSHKSASAAAAAAAKARSRAPKPREHDVYADNYSDSDEGNGSVTSSRREAHVSAEISVDNIVEGGRRKRAKFDSSELPLFVPPQVPASNSISSHSPQRRALGDVAASPYLSNQRNFTFQQPLPSPQSYTRPEASYGQYGGYASHPQQFRPGHVTYGPPRQSTGGILPTPEPTACSTISDEDVALQLMRLGDASNFSYGRTSTSTMDDALSGKAEAASSAEESEEADDELPPNKMESDMHPLASRRKKQRALANTLNSTDSVQSSSDEYDEPSFKGESDEIFPFDYDTASPDTERRMIKAKVFAVMKRDSATALPAKVGKSRPPGPIKTKPRSTSAAKIPISPASLPSQSRKTSAASTINFQAQYGADEEDLSSKPRCQRCRKSKKGCDRQRPCGRCKDAGIGADGCVSEDEGNGRKGRYGRHMGVPVKKGSEAGFGSLTSSTNGDFIAPARPLDKNKKRKR